VPVKVEPDFITVLKLDQAPTTVTLGSPSVADVQVAPGNVLIVTGKGTGSTNLILLDDKGREFLNASIQVGVGRQVYHSSSASFSSGGRNLPPLT
jgi:Flp pilus assembly secretin CpaC